MSMEKQTSNQRIALIGLGNAGGNILDLYNKKYPQTASLILINTSTTDMSKFQPGNFDLSIRLGDFDGTGGQHDVAKTVAMNYMQSSIIDNEKLMPLLIGKEYVFVIGSSAGGTGSGMLPVVYQVTSKVLQTLHKDPQDKSENFDKTIAVCILPEEGLTVDRLDNALLNQSELYSDPDATYMIYDNSRFDIKSSFELKAKINEEIVDDLAVFTRKDFLASDYNNMDAEDMLTAVSVPGRIVIVRGDCNRSINHTDIEERILASLMNKSAHAILDNDRVVNTYALIANLTKDSIEGLNEALPKIREKIGEPVSTFMNLSDKEDVSNVIFIMSGMSKCNARLFELHELLLSKKAKIKTDETVFEYRDEGISSKRRPTRDQRKNAGSRSLEDILKNLK